MVSMPAPVRKSSNDVVAAGSLGGGVVKIVSLTLFALALSTNVNAQSFSNVPAPKLGPLALGMSLEDVQVNLPGADWRVEARLPSGKPSRYAADHGLEWAGDKANVTLESTYDRRQIQVSFFTREADAQSCLQRAKNWSLKLADSSGALVGGDQTGQYEDIGLGHGGIGRLNASRGDRYWPTQRWSNQPPSSFYFSAKAAFAPAQDLQTQASLEAIYTPVGCATELTMAQTTARPENIKPLPDALQRITVKPSIGQRHFLASSLKTWSPPMFEGSVRNTDRSPRDILPEPVTAQVRCLISRQTGLAQRCELANGQPTYPTAVLEALIALGASYQFETSGLGFDIDDPAPLQVILPITLSPNDIVSTQFELPDVPLQIPFQVPDGLINRGMPNEALDKGLGAKMLILCQIQSDQSVVCKIESFTETNPEKLAVLRRIYTPSVLKQAHRVKLCPKGCETAPPVGAVFKIDLEFKID
jgi:hypothetical protein